MRYTIKTTERFDQWVRKIKDVQALSAIASRLIRFENGQFGDVKSVGGQVSEARIFVGKGYRLYFTVQDCTVIVMLCGGHKDTQAKDIKTAKQIIKQKEQPDEY
ncbi:type II toxin-antitoxin system RelE/ParE family toxin [Ostreibacterium oceani]|uniref:Type II toxin-antitoxin system RelE/ParE family toxin n=1 Tax=Ostreibacterium oceani TaxID=2654998 RepID=A0A6N7EV05_9GAMM|nr:type II toxin-antitoxin system RelE/ParE family toxin [Ostreibacterium oceani]MPV85803.1 type II toxin-antitoxin system RelE/ParE family toxin [Ostreibacterium oceani]